jgi:diguanylate cyclase (GGDEF)-like protein
MHSPHSPTHAPQAHVAEHHGAVGGYSLRRTLVALVVMCVLPAVVVCLVLTYAVFQLTRAEVEQRAALFAQRVTADIERELAAVESALRAMAVLEGEAVGEASDWGRRVVQVLPAGLVVDYTLTDVQGRASPLLAAGPTSMPDWAHAALGEGAAAVGAAGPTLLSDGVVSPATGAWTLAMSVPVEVGGEVRYRVGATLNPQHLVNAVSSHALPPEWLVAVLDGSGTIIGRSRDLPRYLGQPAVPDLLAAVQAAPSGFLQTLTKDGVPVFSAFNTLRLGGWKVVVGAPTAHVYQGLSRYLWGVGAAVGLAFVAGLWQARRVVLRVLSSVQGLNDAALALGRGESVRLPRVQLLEAQAVGQAMVQASHAVQRIRFLAQHDALTELPNRLLFAEVAQRTLALASRQRQQVAVLALDLDGFKAVNDTHGHVAGDQVLRAAAQRIQQAIRASDVAARVGGDEFLVLLADVHEDTAMETAQRLVDLLSAPYGEVTVPVSASVGVALYPAMGSDWQTLAAQADQALYAAKYGGKARAVMAATTHCAAAEEPGANAPAHG